MPLGSLGTGLCRDGNRSRLVSSPADAGRSATLGPFRQRRHQGLPAARARGRLRSTPDTRLQHRTMHLLRRLRLHEDPQRYFSSAWRQRKHRAVVQRSTPGRRPRCPRDRVADAKLAATLDGSRDTGRQRFTSLSPRASTDLHDTNQKRSRGLADTRPSLPTLARHRPSRGQAMPKSGWAPNATAWSSTARPTGPPAVTRIRLVYQKLDRARFLGNRSSRRRSCAQAAGLDSPSPSAAAIIRAPHELRTSLVVGVWKPWGISGHRLERLMVERYRPGRPQRRITRRAHRRGGGNASARLSVD